MTPDSVILITGAHGFLGTNLIKYIHRKNIPFDTLIIPKRSDCDLMDRDKTINFIRAMKPDYVFHLAGRVFGIGGNENSQYEAFLANNIINTNVIDACALAKPEKIVAMGTGAVYPASEKPMTEDQIWSGKPHGSEYGYAQAKRAMLAQLECLGLPFSYVISSNLYGEYDKFNMATGHVIPSLIAKFYEASKTQEPVMVWGDGSAVRDFLYVDDAAEALIKIMQEETYGPINMGSGEHTKIWRVVAYLMELFPDVEVDFDSEKPNGQPIRVYNLEKLTALGFKPKTDLGEGLKKTVNWYCEHHHDR